MRLHTLRLAQFRNYGALELRFTGDLHVFVGENASGKTNLLESVAVLSMQESFLSVEEEDLRLWGTEFYRISADVESDAGQRESLEVVSQILPRKKKATFANDVRIPTADMIGKLPTVTFLPQDLELFSGSPAQRRRFLDLILSQVSPAYYQALHEYQRILKQRNALLKRIADGRAKSGELDPWDEKVAEEGSRVTVARLELIETFALTLAEELVALGEGAWEKVAIAYERVGRERDVPALAAEFRGLLSHYRERDILLQATSVGPHRDDWHIEVAGRHLLSFASRGQQRVCVLALLLLEASFLDIRRGERPVILLDDIFSELDDRHQAHVLRSLARHQVLCTTTHLPKNHDGLMLWSVRGGSVTPL